MLRLRGPGSHTGPRRPLFGFGRASAAKSFTERRVVPFTPAQVFDVVVDVDKYTSFLPFCVKSKVTKRESPEKFYAIMGVGFKVFSEAYTSEIRALRPTATSSGFIDIKALDAPTFKTMTSAWRFDPGPEKNTSQVTFKTEFIVANPFAAAAINNFFGTIAEQQMKAFASRCDDLYDKSRETVAAMGDEVVRKESDSVQDQERILDTSDETEDAEGADLTLRVLRSHMPIGWSHHDQPPDKKAFVMPFEIFSAACDQLVDSLEGFAILGRQPQIEEAPAPRSPAAKLRANVDPRLIRLALYESAAQLQAVRSMRHAPQEALKRFSHAVYAMVAANPAERARFIFDLIDTNNDRRLSNDEMNTAMQAHIRAVATVIPKILLHKHGVLPTKDEGAIRDARVSEALARTERMIQRVTHETIIEIPLAVQQILKEGDKDNSGDLNYQEWMDAWHRHPEVLDLMSIRGMAQLVSAALDKS